MITADDEKYMRMALREAEAAKQADEVPIGAVIVCRGRVIARGHNLTETLTDVTAHPGWAITISLEPTFEVRDRCGLSTSTRKMIQKIWPVKLPNMDPEMLARLVFCFENNPERHDGIISGAQDSIGICIPGLCRHYYDHNFWPEKIETTQDEMTLRFLEDHLVMIPMAPRRPGCSVVEDKDITPDKVKALADAADACRTIPAACQ